MLHSTDEAGEPTRRDPVEGRERRIVGAFGGKDAGDIEPWKRLNGTSEGSNAVKGTVFLDTTGAWCCSITQRVHNMRSRMR